MHKTILKLTLSFFACFIFISSFGQINNSNELLHKMYDRYHGKWPATLTFKQTTERFRNDSLIMTQEWEEYIQHPNLFRIDFGDTADHNFVIYKNDSSYLFRKGKLVRATKDENELLFFLGGLYFMPFESVLKHFEELHYDLNKFHKSTWQGKPV